MTQFLTKRDMIFMFKLRSINRWLRWTGWRLTVSVDQNFNEKLKDCQAVMEPTKIGVTWYGWSFVKELDRDLVEKKENEMTSTRKNSIIKMLIGFGIGFAVGFTLTNSAGCAQRTPVVTNTVQTDQHDDRCEEMYEEADVEQMREWCYGEHSISVRVAAQRAACQLVEEYDRVCSSY